MKSIFSGIFRVSHRVEGLFVMGLAATAVAGLTWLATHLAADNWEALSNWLRVFGGDTALDLKTEDYVRGGLMLTALFWIALGAGLLVTRRWWCFEAKKEPEVSGKGIDWRFAAGLALIVLMALAIRWPRMELSFYNDETDWFRVAVAGEFDRMTFMNLESEELPKFRVAPWIKTVWGNRLGNNHALQSILARPLYDGWRSVAGTPPGTIHEWPLRMPALFGGLLSIAAVGVLAALLAGRSRVGFYAAFLLTIQPWHVRYSTEARGYGLAIGFAALAALLLVIALQRGKWRWWLAFAVVQMACLWSYLGSIYLVFGMNAAALALIVWECFRAPNQVNPLRSRRVQGLLVANAISAGLFLVTSAPNLAALRFAMEGNPTFNWGPGADWWPDVLSYLLAGMPWFDMDPGNAANPALVKYLGNPVVVAGLAVAAALAISGAWRLWRRGGTGGRLLVAGPLIGLVLPWAVAEFGESTLLKWYVSYAVIFPPIWMAAGLNAWVFREKENVSGDERPARSTWQRMAIYGLLGLCAAAVSKPLMLYRVHSKQALRPAIELVRGSVYPFENPEEQLHPIVIGWWTSANAYDPYFRICHLPESLDAMIEKARGENRPLYFILGMRPQAIAEKQKRVPVGEIIVKRLEESGDFETVHVFPGLEEEKWRTAVFRLVSDRSAPGNP